MFVDFLKCWLPVLIALEMTNYVHVFIFLYFMTISLRAAVLDDNELIRIPCRAAVV